MQTGIVQAPFGQLPGGEEVTVFTLANGSGMRVNILDFGGIITEIHVPDRAGRLADVALGFDTLAPYLNDSPYFGALIGRYGNRIAGGRFTLDGRQYLLPVNNGKNHLHGGVPGFDRVKWQARVEGEELVLSYRSPDGEQGYPGTLEATVRYRLSEDNAIVVRFHAVTDRATPVNLTQHSYFNLAGGGSILDHEIEIAAGAIVPVDADLVPTGTLMDATGTPFDFRTARPIGARIDEAHEQLRHGGGYDHCFVLDKQPGAMSLAARVRDPGSGRVLELFTQEPGVQFYSGNFLDGSLRGKGQSYPYRGGFCLEPQHFPDSPNQPGFPNTILRPGEVYETESRFRFSVEK
ncbi:galactose mutarotase [Massilia sp. Dwa41.01b]|uniref:aldose epimerase family protein n=1 Tax=unclassified Massilia TaxID=2609279 RepID=UPI001603BE36|nr:MULTISPECIES: aldose epimerase family protein [unclassified Massilia]QNA88278.1 galactose mutarotase [Massilia sp. Dwa41.01b]QNA99181.1 galactose mutarotase [Massilia sp. Se16.2.3]